MLFLLRVMNNAENVTIENEWIVINLATLEHAIYQITIVADWQ